MFPNYDIVKKYDKVIILIILIVIFYVVIKYYLVHYKNNSTENMTSGTLTQLYANDSQDTYLKSNVNNSATGDFSLFWNQPTRVANTFMNRGSPLQSVQVSSNNISQESSNNISQDNSKIRPYNIHDYSNLLYDNLLYNKNCIDEPASCGGGPGGFRLGEDFVQPTNTNQYINLNGNLFYPDSYVGSYFAEPNFDINKPFPVISK